VSNDPKGLKKEVNGHTIVTPISKKENKNPFCVILIPALKAFIPFFSYTAPFCNENTNIITATSKHAKY